MILPPDLVITFNRALRTPGDVIVLYGMYPMWDRTTRLGGEVVREACYLNSLSSFVC